MKSLHYFQRIKKYILVTLLLTCSSIIKAQNLDWVKGHGSIGSEKFVLSKLDSDRNVYTTGIYSEAFSYDGYSLPYMGKGDVFIEKRDLNGDLLWVKSLNTPNEIRVLSLTTTISGDVLIGGIFEGTMDADPSSNEYPLTSSREYGVYIIRLDSSGNLIWAKNYDASYLYDIAEDHTGNILLSITFEGFVELSPTITLTTPSSTSVISNGLIKIDSDTNVLWGYATGTAFAKDITFDNDNNIYIAGFFLLENDFDYKVGSFVMSETGFGSGFPLNHDGYIQKLDSDANFIWAKQLKNPNNTVVHSIAVDQEQNVYTSGVWQASTSGVDFDPGSEIFSISTSEITVSQQFIHKLNTSGDFEWVTTFGTWHTTPNFLDPEQGGTLSLDNNNNLYYAGDVVSIVGESFSFGDITYTPMLQDILLARLNTIDGSVAWSTLISGTGQENVYAADIIDNTWVVSGTFSQDTDFKIDSKNSFPMNSNGGADSFIMKLDITSTLNLSNNDPIQSKELFNIYPNPNSGIVKIENYSNNEFQVKLYNSTGQLVLTKKVNNDFQVDIEHLPSGIYSINISNENNQEYNSKIIKQ